MHAMANGLKKRSVFKPVVSWSRWFKKFFRAAGWLFCVAAWFRAVGWLFHAVGWMSDPSLTFDSKSGRVYVKVELRAAVHLQPLLVQQAFRVQQAVQNPPHGFCCVGEPGAAI